MHTFKQNSRILIIDDQDNWRSVLQDILKSDGYSLIEVTSNLADALKSLDSMDVKLVIVDLRLLDQYQFGYQGLDIIRIAKQRGIKTLAVTGFGTPEIIEGAFQLGLDDYINKGPDFNVAELREKIENLLLQSFQSRP